MSSDKLAALLDDLIERDHDVAERLIEKHLGRLALKKRLQEFKAEQQAGPVAEICKEPDYWNRGHFHEGRRNALRALVDLDALPIGTKLYAHSATGQA